MMHHLKPLSIFSSIRSKLILLLLVLVGMPLLVTGYLSYRSASDALLRQSTQQLGNLANKTAQQIDNFFLSARKDIGLLADYPFVPLAFLQFEFNQRLDTVQRLLVDYSEKNAYFKHIYLIGLDGIPILSVPATDLEHENFSSAPWFIHTLKHGTCLSDVDLPTASRHSGIFLGKIIHDFEDASRPVGVLAFHIKPSAYSDFAGSLHVGSGGYAYLMHQTGYFIHHPENILNFIEDVTPHGDERLRELTRQMSAAPQGHGLYSVFGQEKFLVFSLCRERPWIVGITVSKAELMVDINRFLKKMLTFLAGLILLILPVSYLFIHGITRPINQLIIGAGRIGRGDLNQIIHIESNDELRAVADEFNNMAVRLKTSMDEIIDLKNFNEDILRNVTSGIITVDRNGQITSYNDSAVKILEYDVSIQDMNPLTNMPAYLLEIVKDLTGTLQSGQNVEHKEQTIARPGQEPIYVEVNTSLLSSKTGKVFGAIADIRDITQRKHMEETMLRVEKLASLGELSAGMAHEIRNPLAGIKTSVQVLSKRVANPEAKELLAGIESEINRLDKIVGDLLRFSRPASPQAEAMRITCILDQTLDLMIEKLKIHRITVEKRYAVETPTALVDREQIRQVFLNLVLNSINAMETGGHMIITVHPADLGGCGWGQAHGLNDLQLSHYVKVVFADTGKGIAPEHLPRVFDPFFSTDPKGTGLGLSIVHKLIQENNGRIFMDSTVGGGTRVILLLPAVEEELYE